MILKKIVVLCILIILIMSLTKNSLASKNYVNSQDDFDIEIDTMEKTIRMSENAIFYWNVSVSEDVKLRKFEFSVGAPDSNFSIPHFELRGGEIERVTQIYFPETIIENESFCHVTWIIREYTGLIEVDTYMVAGVLRIHIINETGIEENNTIDSNGSNSKKNIIIASMIIGIPIALVILIIFKRKK